MNEKPYGHDEDYDDDPFPGWDDDDFEDHSLPDSEDLPPPDVGAGTELPPFLDQEVADELDEDGPPSWLGIRWRDIPVEQQPEAWNGLRRWVDWFIAEYRLKEADVPKCWYRHPDITAELYAAMNMEYKVWEEQSPSLSPMMMWHVNLFSLRMRLKEMTADAGCVNAGTHQEPLAYSDSQGAFQLAYDEQDWATFTTQYRQHHELQRPVSNSAEDGDTLRYRAVVVNEKDEHVAVSNVVGLKPATAHTESGVGIEFLSRSSDLASVISTARMSDGHRLVWQSSTDGQHWQAVEDTPAD